VTLLVQQLHALPLAFLPVALMSSCCNPYHQVSAKALAMIA